MISERIKPALPRHVAIIMDGNGRWARARMLPRNVGHREGVKAVRCVVEAARDHGIEVLTLFAFSSENWKRPNDEIGMLMSLFVRALEKEVDVLHRNAIRLRFIGDRSAFSSGLCDLIERAEERTRENKRMDLVIAANYGGQWDITRAAQALARKVHDGLLEPDAIDSETLAAEISLNDIPAPDLFIRTGGEQRISNFLLWQLAYTELYFTDILWPAFDETAFDDALSFYETRQRRFGCTGEQVEKLKGA